MKFVNKSVLTLQEFTCLSTTVKSNSSIPFFNLTLHPGLNNAIFIRNPKHIPLPNNSIKPSTVLKTIKNLKESLLWKSYFLDEPEDTNPKTRYNPKFKIIPRQDITPFPHKLLKHIDPLLPTSFTQLKHNINNIFSTATTVMKRLNNPIKTLLSKYSDTFITLADKNLGFVALPKSVYIDISLVHLNNEETYINQHATVLTITDRTKTAYQNFIRDNENHLYPNELTFLTKQTHLPVSLPNFKSMPKLHKAGPLKSRPIITAFNWYTRPIALILNERIQPYTENLPYVIQSSRDLLSQLPDYVLQGYSLVTIDVKAMYPSIDRNELTQVINSLPTNSPLPINLLRFILNNSYCHFQEQTYLQIEGIPMGDNASVGLANLFCSSHIDPTISQHPLISKYCRYIDDIFMIWKGSLQDLNTALVSWNNLSSLTLEVTQFSNTSVEFLDVSFNVDTYTRRLHSSIYFKSISKFNYLSPSSCHPPHVLRGWISAEIKRHYQLTSHPITRDCNLLLFKEHLLTRGYSLAFVNSLLNKAKIEYHNPPQNRSPSTKIIHCILPYYPDATSIRIANTINAFLKETARNFFPDHRPLIAYSKLPNLASFLSKSP